MPSLQSCGRSKNKKGSRPIYAADAKAFFLLQWLFYRISIIEFVYLDFFVYFCTQKQHYGESVLYHRYHP